MLAIRDNIAQSIEALRQHKLRAVLTIIGLTMGVATLITVMTLVQGANAYVEQKIARLGTNVFQVAKSPFVLTDFNLRSPTAARSASPSEPLSVAPRAFSSATKILRTFP
jgi:ABC-type antimicrobial peptide transport system permease subunit